ncbi:rhodanese-like domain-containing protein [Haloarchaeobius amylolyticus]|uniref:rhodanese-like domain-containing protein n=1 Tax=Haloarchaeobius amylolyticus TaxID=1198296 RepID=UPI00226F5786|nr:rhodanese-like domain-containing protein [Haloarchaeobius amylolyticus]
MSHEQGERRQQVALTKGYRDLVREARAAVRAYQPTEALARFGDDDVLFVDVRDGGELRRTGKIPGAIHASRGMLEFYLDPKSPHSIDAIDPAKELVFYSAGGSRAALAAQRAAEMGFPYVIMVEDGFDGWRRAGGPVQAVTVAN